MTTPSTPEAETNGTSEKPREIKSPLDARALMAELKLYRDKNETQQREIDLLNNEVKKLKTLFTKNKRKLIFAEAVERVMNDINAQTHAKKAGIEKIEI